MKFRPRRIVRITMLSVSALLALAVSLIVLVTQTSSGREWLRQLALRLVADRVQGSAYLGSLRIGRACAVGIDSLALRGSRGDLLLATGPVRGRCDVLALIRGQIVLTELRVEHPFVAMSREPDGAWNWARAFRKDTSSTSHAPGRATVIDGLTIRDGTILVAMPWLPPDSLTGARRDSAIAFNLERADVTIRREAGGYVRRRYLRRLSFDVATLRVGGGDTTIAVRLDRLVAHSTDPPLDVQRVRGWVRRVGGTMNFDVPHFAIGGSAGSLSGEVGRDTSGRALLDIHASADPLALADVAWVRPGLPRDGRARVELEVHNATDPLATDYVLKDLDVQSGDSHLRGHAAFALGGKTTSVKDVALTFAPVNVELLRTLTRGALPNALRGELNGYIRARGGPLDRFHVDSADVAFRDAAVRGAESRLAARGELDISAPEHTRFRGFSVALRGIDLRTFARLAPGAPPLHGVLSGGATLDSAWNDVRFSNAKLVYSSGAAEPLRLLGNAHVAMGTEPRFDIALRAAPLSFAVLAPVEPALAHIPSVVGDVHANGVTSDFTVRTTLAGRGGDVQFDGRIRTRPRPAIEATGRIEKLDLREALGKRSLPRSDLDVAFAVDAAGDSLGALEGTLSATVPRGAVGEATLRPSRLLLRFADRRVYADTVTLATSAGEIRAKGALGLTRAVRDTFVMRASTDSVGSLLRLATRQSAGRPSLADSASGRLALDARLIGSIDSLDIAGSVDGHMLRAGSSIARRANVVLALTDLPSAPRGRAELRVDSLEAGPLRTRQISASAEATVARQWRVALRSDHRDSPGGAVTGTVELDSAARVIGLDSLELWMADRAIRLKRPGHVRLAGSTIVADTLELLGSHGARLRFGGTYSDSGAIDLTMSAASIPLPLPFPVDTASTRGAPRGDSATAHGDLEARLTGTSAAPRLTAHGTVRVARGADFPLDSVEANATYTGRRGTFLIKAVGGGRRVLAANATVPMDFALSPWRLSPLDTPLQGRVVLESTPLRDILVLTPAVDATAGVARADLALRGTGRHPRFDGAVRLDGGAVAVPSTGTRVQDVTADVQFRNDSIVLRKVSATGAGERSGRASLDGLIRLADARDPTFDLRLRLSTMPLLSTRQLADLAATADLRLRGARRASTLSGAITVDRVVVRIPDMGAQAVANESDPEFVRLLDSITARRPEPRSTLVTSFVRHLRLGNVGVRMGPEVWLRSSEVNVNLGGAIDVTHAGDYASRDTSAGRLALRGSLDVQRGTFRLDLGVVQRTFTLEEGSLEFRGEPELNPHLDLSALYVVAGAQGRQQDVRIRVRLGGTLKRPTLTLSDARTSGVALSEDQLLSYLVTGQSSVDVGSGETYRNLVGTEVATRLASAAAEKLTGGFFDVVSVSTGSAEASTGAAGQTGGSALAGSRLGLGKQVSHRTFLTLNAGMCSLGGSSGFDAAQFSESIGVSLEQRFRPDLGLTLSSEPSTDALYCAQGGVSRGAAASPRQFGFDLLKRWRF